MIIDAHEDIAWNMLTFNRDYMRGARGIRDTEKGTPIPARNGNALLGYGEWSDGGVSIIFSTLFASPARRRTGDWDTQVYSNQEEAYALASRQMKVYRDLAENGPFCIIETQQDLSDVLEKWDSHANEDMHQIGLVLLMEGADPILHPDQARDWYQRGVRLIGPAWEATQYAGGTHEPGPLTDDGKALLAVMREVGAILDVSHLAEAAFYQAMDLYDGVIVATHANPRRFLPTSRGLSDEMIRLLAERNGVMGVVPYNLFLDPNWRRGDPKEAVSLQEVANAIDHVCQINGNADHVALGSDFDGGFGLEHVPAEIDTVADLNRLDDLLESRGYTPQQASQVMFGNWLRILRAALPA